MTDLAPPIDPETLEKIVVTPGGFTPAPGGQEVTESGVKLSNTSGLHAALAIDGLELPVGATGVLTLHFEVRKVTFEAIDTDDLAGPLRRVHGLHVTNAADGDTADNRARLDAQAKRLAEALAEEEQAKRAAKGELPFDADDGPVVEFCAHDRPAAECTDCPPLPLDELADKRTAADG
jgi:hypothetical protein